MIITNLLTNMIVLGLSGEIPTNTPAFQQYAIRVLLTNAQSIAKVLRIDHNLVSTEKMTAVEVKANPASYSASATFADRYAFYLFSGEGRGGAFTFSDKVFDRQQVFAETNRDFAFHYRLAHKDDHPDEWDEKVYIAAEEGDRKRHAAVVDRWTRTTNQLTFASARRMAESAVHLLELTGLRGSPRGEQMEWEDRDRVWVQGEQLITGEHGRVIGIKGFPETGPGTVSVVGPFRDGQYLVTYTPKQTVKVLLPYYGFKWKVGRAQCEVDVCGINSNIVFMRYTGPKFALPMPPNYLRMLGIPTNSIFVQQLSPGRFKKYELLK